MKKGQDGPILFTLLQYYSKQHKNKKWAMPINQVLNLLFVTKALFV